MEMIFKRRQHRGFTLVELLVVIGMIAVIMGALTTSVTTAQTRARIQRATSDVKVITQAILAYENYDKGNGKFELEEVGGYGAGGADCDASSLAFLLGNNEAAQSGGQIPALLMASLRAGGKMMDPWGTPYKLHISQGKAPGVASVATATMQSGYFLPNFYRLAEGER